MRVIYAIILLFLLASCHKDGSGLLSTGDGKTTVEGKVTEIGSNKPIANAQVNLRSLPGGSTTALYRTDTTVYTDANGNYAFSFDADKERSYEVQPKLELYNNTNKYKPVTSNRKNKIDLELDAYAWVRVHIINEPPLDTVLYVGFNGFENPPNGIYGAFSSDSTIIGKVIGNKNDYLMTFWKYTKLNALENKMRIDYYAPAHDTVDYYFKY